MTFKTPRQPKASMFISPQYISDFGDSAVTGSLAIVLGMVFFATHNDRQALAMPLAFFLAGLFVGVAKIIFYSCHVTSSVLNLHSPSGHAAVSSAVYGTFAIIAASSLHARYRGLVYLLTACFVLAIGVTRVMLGYHTPAEVALGFFVGLSTCFVVWLSCLRRSRPLVNRVLFVAVALGAILLLHGIRLPAEVLIDKIAAHLAIGCMR